MEATLPFNRASLPRKKPRSRRYWTGFTVCLFVVLLSVFTWVIHRRLTQYELQQAGGHRMTATKVCLTDRNQTSLPTAHELGVSGMLLAAVVLAGVPGSGDDSPQAFIGHTRPRPLGCARSRPCLAHFLFLPPPSLLSL